ncbi:MAG: DUF1631 domain-containing protein [Burkholderiales bacterium]|nr:DUF1631 domain-containing protein [Burkholderiales bacterium]
MAATLPSNVVALGSHDKSARPAGAGDPFAVARECRELAVSRLAAAMRATVGKVEQDLFELAYNSTDRETRNQYFEARDDCRVKLPAFCSKLEGEFVNQFNAKARRDGARRPPAPGAPADAMELSLVEDGVLEDNIALGNLVAKLRDVNKDALYALTRRMAVVLQNPQLEDIDNPLGPETIGAAIKAALGEFKLGRKSKPTVVKLIEQYLIDEVETIYADLNDLLIQRNVLPQIRLGARRTQSAPNAARTATSDGRAPDLLTGDAKDWFALLQQLVSGGAVGAPAAGGPLAAAGAPAPGAQWPVAAPQISAAALQGLTQLQRGSVEALGVAARAFDPAMLLSGKANVLRDIKGTNVTEGFAQVDAMTIDIVAMLFDYVFDDKRIPDAIKALIGRLQIPILKVAILDKRFFSAKSHPARKLLDALAASAVGWTGAADATDPLYGKIDSIVQRVIAGFDSDVAVFEDMVAELESFLDDEEQRLASFSEQSAKVVHERERLEIARVIAHDEVQRRLETREMPEAVSVFLQQSWEKALIVSYAAHGEGSEHWALTLATMDDLLWSVTPKENAEERKKLVGLLPTLLKRLHAGMDLIALAPESRNRFFAELVRCHAQAVKSGLGAHMPPPPPRLEVVVPAAAAPEEPAEPQDVWDGDAANADAPKLVATRVNQGDVLIEEIKIQGPGRLEDEDPRRKWDNYVSSLVRGMWVQFLQQDGATIRAKLTWISPLKGIYLFSNPSGARALAFEPKALAEAFRRGRAEVISDSPLVESAMNSMVSSLEQRPLTV